jgi:hypothetical protein
MESPHCKFVDWGLQIDLGIGDWRLGISFEHLLGAARADPQPAGLIDQSSITE